MSNYHRAGHRASETVTPIANWGDTRGNGFYEVGRGDTGADRAIGKTKVAQDHVKSYKLPEKVVHVNVSKASPDVQKAIKGNKKIGKDTYLYQKKK
jgi:hypothetical protein